MSLQEGKFIPVRIYNDMQVRAMQMMYDHTMKTLNDLEAEGKLGQVDLPAMLQSMVEAVEKNDAGSPVAGAVAQAVYEVMNRQ